jgi:hypothetical protein
MPVSFGVLKKVVSFTITGNLFLFERWKDAAG